MTDERLTGGTTDKGLEEHSGVNGAYGDVSNQVHTLTKTILGITRNVEAALVNIRTISTVLQRISEKLKDQEVISEDEKSLLKLTEKWLAEENRTCGWSAICSQLVTLPETENYYAKSHEKLTSLTNSPSSTGKQRKLSTSSTRTDDVELDWDGNGVGLNESYNSNYAASTKDSTFLDPMVTLRALSLSDQLHVEHNAEKQEKVTPYQDVYEEEMELTLELEEGFYSDSSFSDTKENLSSDFSPQTDSGVTQLDNTSNDRSIVYGDLLSETVNYSSSPSYNRDLNPWNLSATVNIDDDLTSASEAEQSNTSTPQLGRKTLINLEGPIKGALYMNAKVDDGQNGLDQDSTTKILPASKKDEPLPHDLHEDLNHSDISPGLEDIELTSASSLESDTSRNTSVLITTYSKPPDINDSYRLPEGIHQNNYYRKPPRKPVFV